MVRWTHLALNDRHALKLWSRRIPTWLYVLCFFRNLLVVRGAHNLDPAFLNTK